VSNKAQTIRVIALRQPFVAFELHPWRPPLNMYETDQALVLVVDLAGVDPFNLHIHVQPSQVAVHGTRHLAVPASLRRINYMEIGSGPFQLELQLTTTIDPSRAEAHYADGLLEIGLPYATQPSHQAVVIRVNGGTR
jgi:HSP20 family protein